MLRSCLPALAAVLSLGSLAASAATIPYPNPGTVAPQSTLVATNTGDFVGYWVGGSTGGDDSVRLFDVTAGTFSSYLLPTHESTVGESANFGHVTAGDILVLELRNSDIPNAVFASNAAYSTDGVNHAYVTDFSGGVLNGFTYAPGSYFYVGMSDLPAANSSLNYADTQLLFTNLSSTPSAVPEPGSLMLLGTGALGAVGMLRRKLFA